MIQNFNRHKTHFTIKNECEKKKKKKTKQNKKKTQ